MRERGSMQGTRRVCWSLCVPSSSSTAAAADAAGDPRNLHGAALFLLVRSLSSRSSFMLMLTTLCEYVIVLRVHFVWRRASAATF